MSEQVVVITGATSGIGQALAREMAARGAHLVLVGRRADRLDALVQELTSGGRRAIGVPADVTRDEDMPLVMARALKEFGRVDVVVANAGFGVAGSVEKLSLDDFRRQNETNVFGVLRTVQAAIPALKASRGRLALVGSVNGYVALPGNSAYAMSKFAVRALALSLRHELRPFGISVTHIAPGFVESEIRIVDNKGVLHPNARDRVPKWLQMPAPRAARCIAKGIENRRSEVVVTGHGKLIVWIVRHFPWLIELFLARAKVTARPEPKRSSSPA